MQETVIAGTPETDAASQQPVSASATWTHFDYVLLAALVGLLAHDLFYLLIGLRHTIEDYWGFRQTQTALTAYWLAQGGPWLAYETPVLGYPWTVPLEFPVYQLLTAALTLIGIPIDVGGRLVSFAFFVGALGPLWLLLNTLDFPRSTRLIVSILFLASPLYIFYARTLMIESTAVFFGLLWLACLAQFLKRRSWGVFAATLVAGSLATVSKVTTFPPFGFLGGVLILAYAFRSWRAGIDRDRLATLALAAMAVLVPLLVAYAWVVYSDQIKLGSPISALFTSAALQRWSLGYGQQRISLQLWHDVLLSRTLPDIFGYAALIAIPVLGASLLSRKYGLAALLSVAAFLVPFLIFTNLHLVHSYYQNANALFALAAVAFSLGALAAAGQQVIVAALLAAIVMGQLDFFKTTYANFIWNPSNPPGLIIALKAKEMTRPDESLLVLGLDWSSVVPYYSERKSLAVPNVLPTPLLQQVVQDPQAFLGDRKFGGIVWCADGSNAFLGDRSTMLEAFFAGRTVLAEAGPCKLLSPQR
jgi:hypothetical protein